MDEFNSSLDNLFVLFEVNFSSSNNINLATKKNDDDLKINDYLKKIDSLIKENYCLREKTPDLFYEFVYKIFQQVELFKNNKTLNMSTQLKDEKLQTDWNILNLIINCLKNTAAAHKSCLNQNEDLIVKFLIDYLNANCNDDLVEIEEKLPSRYSFHLNTFKYISNIILGNSF